MSRTVIIHGRSASDDEVSPRVGREDCELWLGYTGVHKDWTRRFDVHPVEHAEHYHDGIKGKRPEQWEEYRQEPHIPSWATAVAGGEDFNRPIYLLEAHPEVSASVAYPLAEVQEKLPALVNPSRLTTTVDMMCALLLVEKFQHVIFHNIGLITDDWQTTALNPEWADRHKGIFYWLGVLEASGIPVDIEGDSIFKAPTKVYGYETAGRDYGIAQRRYFTKRRG